MATKYKYDKDTDYAALMERAAQRGDNAAAAIYEQQRNAKIRGEGMTDVTQSNDYAQYLPLEDAAACAKAALVVSDMFSRSREFRPNARDRKSTRLNSSHKVQSRMPSSA